MVKGYDAIFGRALVNTESNDEANVSDQLQFEFEAFLFRRFASFSSPRHLIARGRKVLIPASTAPAFADYKTLTGFGKITNHGWGAAGIFNIRDFINDRAGWNMDHKIFAILARSLRGSAFDAFRCFELLIAPKC